jgi:hypothetical protein
VHIEPRPSQRHRAMAVCASVCAVCESSVSIEFAPATAAISAAPVRSRRLKACESGERGAGHGLAGCCGMGLTCICRKLGLLGARCDFPRACLLYRPRRCQLSTPIFRSHLDKSRTKLSVTVLTCAQRGRGKRPKYQCFVIRSALFAGARLPGQASWSHLDKKSNKALCYGLCMRAQ